MFRNPPANTSLRGSRGGDSGHNYIIEGKSVILVSKLPMKFPMFACDSRYVQYI